MSNPELSRWRAGGACGRLIATRDWARTSLGPISAWPADLKSTISLILLSPVPIVTLWGEEGVMLYNDAYSVFAGGRHPELLGAQVREGWPEVADFNDNVMRVCLGGGTLSYKDQELTLYRNGGAEQVWMNLDYSPVLDDAGLPIGVICVLSETTQRVAADAALKAERDRSTGVLENMGEGFVLLDHDFRVLDINAYGMRFEDRPREEILGKSHWEAWPGTEESELGRLVKRAMAERAPLSLEHRYDWADGRAIWFEMRAYPAVDGLALFYRDITSRRADAEALRASEERLRVAQEAGEIGTFELIPETGRLIVSEQFCRLWGVAPTTEADLATFLNVVHPDDRSRILTGGSELPTRALDYIEYRIVRPDTGEVRWIARRGDPILGQAERTRYLGVCFDVTDRKVAEMALQEANDSLERRVAEALAERKLLADIVESNDAFVQIADRNFDFLGINRASVDEFERIYGIRPKVGDNMLALLADKPEHRAAVERVWARALAGEEFTEVAEFGEPGRARRFYEMKFNALRDAEGQLIGAYQFVHDVTERLRDERRLAQAEEALRQSQKMEAVGQLVSGIAHDFNNLLGAIVGALDLISHQPENPERVRRFAKAGLEAADRGAKLTKQLLAFSRSQRIELKPILVCDVIEGLREMLARTLGPMIELEFDLNPMPVPVMGDATQVEMTILNLAVNARDAMPEGGQLRIATAPRTIRGDAELQDGDYVELTVADTGQGMDDAILRRAMDPFFTTKTVGKGTGLGLAQVYGSARQSGGTVRLESEVGKGTTVRVLLPRTETLNADEADAGDDGKRGLCRSTQILLVDDDDDLRGVLANALAAMGHSVSEAADGASALAALAQERPDVLVVDFAMPGMTGAEVAKAARERWPDLPVVLASGYPDQEAIERAVGAGARVLRKPFRIDELLGAVGEAVMSHL